ncbi:MAG: hypothetical protein RMJ46_07670 [Bacteroidota bacterium]|nr:hypothetical protein [Bacteroidota bacterium]
MKTVVVFFVIAFALGITGEAVSQQIIEFKPPSEETLTGVIKKADADGSVVSVQTGSGTSQDVLIIFNRETTLTFDGKGIKAIDLRPGQTVAVKYTSENTVAIVNNVPTGEVVLRTAKSVSAVSPSRQTETALAEKAADLTTAGPFKEQDVAEVVGLLIATLLSEQLSHSASFVKHELAPRLRGSLKRFGTGFCILSNKLWIGMHEDKITVTTDEEWAPLFCIAIGGERTFPKVELGKGQLGLQKLDEKYVDAYAKDGTHARINDEIFTYHGGWKKQ